MQSEENTKKKHRMPKNGAAIDVTQCVGKEQRNYNLTALVVCLCPTADEKFLLLLNINSSCWISVERKEEEKNRSTAADSANCNLSEDLFYVSLSMHQSTHAATQFQLLFCGCELTKPRMFFQLSLSAIF